MDTISDLDIIVGVARAIHHNMSYLQTVSVTDVMAESCFRNPAIEFLERRHNSEEFKIFLEQVHPVFKSKRIDLAWGKGIDKKDKIVMPTTFLEMKYVKEETADGSEIQRYFNDLTRLAILCSNFDANSNKDYNCYFLASGNWLYWNTCFKQFSDKNKKDFISPVKVNAERKSDLISSDYSNWLSFNLMDYERIIHTSDYKSPYFDEFCEHYVLRSSDAKPDPNQNFSFRTQLLWLSESEPELTNATVTGLWKICGI